MNFLTTWSDRQKGLSAAILTATCWSFLAIILKYALLLTDPITIVWYRMAVPFFAMVFWFLFNNDKKKLLVLKSPPGPLLIAGLALGLNYLGFMKGIEYTSPANAQIFIQLGPLFLALMGVMVFKESLSSAQILGFAICTIGFSLFYLDRLSFLKTGDSDFTLGLIWILTGAVAWTLFASVQKTQLPFWKSSQINTYLYLVSSCLFLPWVQWNDLWSLSIWNHLLLVFLGLNTIVAYGSLSYALQYLPLTQVTPIITLNPLFTLLFIYIIDGMSWAFIPKDPVSLQGYIGAFLAILGTIIVLSKRKLKPINSATSRVKL